MAERVWSIVVLIMAAYAILGCVFAVWFAARGASRLDPGAAHAPLGFRLIIIPGAVALWPWLVRGLLVRRVARVTPAEGRR